MIEPYSNPDNNGELLRVTALEFTQRIEIVYNLGVQKFHAYFVGAIGAWVHNCMFL